MKIERKFSIYWFLEKLFYQKLLLQDWWWRCVRAPLTNRKDERLQTKWRAKYGYNQWEKWAPGEGILKHSMLVLREWLKEEWGNPPTYTCITHTKKMHNEVERFVFRAERYFKMCEFDPELPLTQQGLEDRATDAKARHELEVELYAELAKLIKKYGTVMWT